MPRRCWVLQHKAPLCLPPAALVPVQGQGLHKGSGEGVKGEETPSRWTDRHSEPTAPRREARSQKGWEGNGLAPPLICPFLQGWVILNPQKLGTFCSLQPRSSFCAHTSMPSSEPSSSALAHPSTSLHWLPQLPVLASTSAII